MKRYGVAVVGGGFSGVAAAISAARAGADVIIIEKSNCFGGAAANCLVNPFMPFTTKINGERVELSAGIFKEICNALKARGAYGMQNDSFLEEELKYILQEMLVDAGVKILLHAYLSSVECEGGTVTSATFATRGGALTVEADYFIDATGDAQLAYLAGFETRLGREADNLCQPMTLCFRLGNCDVDRFYASRPALAAAYRAARESGEITNPRENVLVFKTPIKNVLHFNTTRVILKNPTSAEDVSEAEIIARRQVYEIYDFMKRHADGLEDSYLMMSAAEIGVRESRMIVGEYVLTEEDCKGLARFDDAIAACNYDIDIHNPEGSGTSHYYFADGDYYTIPYRSLIPRESKNLLVAGRCISSDHGAQASYRIMPVVTTLGEAAGLGAALAKKNASGVSEIDISVLRSTLVSNGAFIG